MLKNMNQAIWTTVGILLLFVMGYCTILMFKTPEEQVHILNNERLIQVYGKGVDVMLLTRPRSESDKTPQTYFYRDPKNGDTLTIKEIFQ